MCFLAAGILSDALLDTEGGHESGVVGFDEFVDAIDVGDWFVDGHDEGVGPVFFGIGFAPVGMEEKGFGAVGEIRCESWGEFEGFFGPIFEGVLVYGEDGVVLGEVDETLSVVVVDAGGGSEPEVSGAVFADAWDASVSESRFG